ncbi:MAG: hypothetical protein ACFFE6_05970 [Candidatus Thorarchaeota archaeon]
MEMIIAVSDIHLGSQMANKRGFSDFIHGYLDPNQNEISRIILLGDILDLWRNSNSQVLLQNLDVLAELGRLDIKKNYLAGNHDYAVFSLLNQSSIPVPPDSTGVLDEVSETLELNFDGLNLKFIHGHQVDYWSALRFYEIFSQAMCIVNSADEELSDVWTIINLFAESIPEGSRELLKELSYETKLALERKLSGPIEGEPEGEKTGLYYEWNLLRKVSDFEDVATRSGKPLEVINQFTEVWGKILETVDQYSAFPIPPPHIANEVHRSRRMAADISVGLQEDQFLIRGHGHVPYVNQEAMVADAGCWLGNAGSYLEIEDGQVSVHRW